MKRLPRVEYTLEARRDFDRCRHFLRRHSPENAWRRTRDLVSAIRRIRQQPELRPVRAVAPDGALPLRRWNVGQFVIVYVYFKPDAAEPSGLVSLRAFRHAREEDVLWDVRDCSPSDAAQERIRLSTHSAPR
jgi:plasmid stabilization system protein ParE